MTLTYNDAIALQTESCCECGVIFAMPMELYRNLRNKPAQAFYCPNGHSMSFKENQADKLRLEAEAKLALANTRVEQLEQELKKKRGRARK